MMSGVVVDASAALELTREGNTTGLPDTAVFAPALIDIEILSALRRFVRLGELTFERAADRVRDWSAAEVTRSGHELLLPRIWDLRDNFSAYDAAYVALAEGLDIPLITTDRRLARAAEQYCEVMTLGE